MIAILLVSSLLFLFTLTAGRYVLLKTDNGTGLLLTDTIITGTALVNAFLTVYSLILPTGVIPFGILGTITLILLIRFRFNKEIWPHITRRTWMFFIPFVLMISLLAADGPRNGDSISYHIPAINWIGQYAVIPGLGNLHGRFAFNPNIFNLMAGFTFTDFAGQSIYAVNAFFSMVFFLYLINLFSRRSGFSLGALLFFMITGVLSVQFMLLRLSSPTPDLIAGLLPVYIFLRYVDFMMGSPQASSAEKSAFLLMITATSVYAVTVKLSSLFILLLPLLLIWSYRHIVTCRKMLFAGLMCFVIIVPWLIRNYYLSGYLLYPASELDIFNPDWKIPGWAVIREKLIVYYWAKWPAEGSEKVGAMVLSEWLPFWFSKLQFFWKFFLSICLISPPVVCLLYWKHRRLLWAGTIFRMWLVCFGGVMFWFYSAPDPRFGYPFIIISTLSILLFLGTDLPSGKTIANRISGFSGMLIILVCYLMPLKGLLQIRNTIPSMLILPLPDDTYATDQLKAQAAPYSPDKISIDRSTFPVVNDSGSVMAESNKAMNAKIVFRGSSIRDGFKMTVGDQIIQ